MLYPILFSKPFAMKYRNLLLIGFNLCFYCVMLVYICLCFSLLDGPLSSNGFIRAVGIIFILAVISVVSNLFITPENIQMRLKKWEKEKNNGFVLYMGKRAFLTGIFVVLLYLLNHKQPSNSMNDIILMIAIFLFLMAGFALVWVLDSAIAPYIEKRLEALHREDRVLE